MSYLEQGFIQDFWLGGRGWGELCSNHYHKGGTYTLPLAHIKFSILLTKWTTVESLRL